MYAVSYDIPADEAHYHAVAEKVGPEPVDGRLSHLAVRLPDGAGIRVIEVWESQAASDRAMATRVAPAVEAASGNGGLSGTAEPVELPLVAFTGIFPTIRLSKPAPLRSEPYVRRANVTRKLTDLSTRYPVSHQCLAQYIEHRQASGTVWNEYWVWVMGQSSVRPGSEWLTGGWLSMVDVATGGNGEHFPELPKPERPFGT